MPQTLLGLLALAILTQLTFSQQRVTMKAHQNQLRDEFSVAASGRLMAAMELLAARPFDAETVPGTVKNEGLPAGDGSDFSSLGPGGSDTGCDLFEVDLDACNDLDDYYLGPDALDENWWPADVELSNGYTLPFEIHVGVVYVNGDNPDVALDYYADGPTKDKRVTLKVRTSLLKEEGTFIELQRVISYDPIKATADCVEVSALKGWDDTKCSLYR